MRAVLAVTALVAVMLVPLAEAHPPAPIDKRGKPVYGKRHAWLHQSKMPLMRGRLRLISGACPGRPLFAGCVFTRRPRTLYVRPGARNPKSVLYHELGHTFDLLILRNRDRSAFKRALKLRGRWFRGAVPPSELFAEAYALCARFGTRRPATSRLGWTRSVYGYRPTRAQHRSVCRIIARAGARSAPRPQPPANAPPVIEQKPPQPPSQQPPPQQPLVPGLPPLLPIPGAV